LKKGLRLHAGLANRFFIERRGAFDWKCCQSGKRFSQKLNRFDPKERAEHVMLVDLARNDIGRVCDFGSVQVRDLMIIKRYSHVMHIVSSVEGKLSAGKTPYDLTRATFPARPP